MKVKYESFYKLKTTVPLFNNFTDDELVSVLKISVSRVYRENELIFREKEVGDSFFIIAKGSVTISKRISAEVNEYLMTLGSGSYFGEMSIIDSKPRSASARVAEDNTILLEINKSVITKNLSVAFKFYKNFSSVLAERLRKTNEKMLETSVEKTNLLNRVKLIVKSNLEKNSSLDQCSFKGTDLTGVFFNKVSMKEAIMNGARLDNATLKSVSLENANFSGSDLQGVAFESCDFKYSNFTNVSFEKSVFKNCSFDNENIKELISG